MHADFISCGGPVPPLLNPQNGHYYWSCWGTDDFGRNLSWHGAQNAAAAMSYAGVLGHLVTLTSAEENTFLTENLPRGYRFEGWIGASDAEVEGEWRWVVGPEAGELFWLGGPDGAEIAFADWHGGEPNNQPTGIFDEDYAMMGWGSENWNDLPASDRSFHHNFVVEFSVPEPGSYALLAIGGAALAIHARSRRRN